MIEPVGRILVIIESKFIFDEWQEEVFEASVLKDPRQELNWGDRILCKAYVLLFGNSDEKKHALVNYDGVLGVVMRHEEPPPVATPEEIAERRARDERLIAEGVARASYKPESPTRSVTPNGEVIYEASTDEMVPPGADASLRFGVSFPDPTDRGWPGQPQTRSLNFGLAASFTPKYVRLPLGFAMTGFFGGSCVMSPAADWRPIPSEWLAPGMPQPEYPTVERGLSMTITVRNTTDKQCACRGQIVGVEPAGAVASKVTP